MVKELILGKAIWAISKLLGFGSGSTWPGHVILTLNSSFLQWFNNKYKGRIVIIAGTNGKTTTSKMLRTILEANGQKVIHNEAGANLLNGIASALIQHSNLSGNFEQKFAIFEVDENTLPLLLNEITPDALVILNLFRDQLDRYGEVDSIAAKWHKALLKLPKNVDVILNADDPHIAFLGKDISPKVSYFGIDDDSLYLKTKPHAMDASHCPNCGERLVFEGIYLAHLGKWQCASCGAERPVLDYSEQHKILPGIYNFYNVQAAILAAKTVGINNNVVKTALLNFAPAFGRQEEFIIDGKKVKIFLSKNPTGFNESIRTIKELGAKNVLLVLNDRIPDGRDVSWIWDVDTEELISKHSNIVVSGDRAYDIGLRLKYSSASEFLISNFQFSLKNSNFKFQIEENLKKAVALSLEQLPKLETLYILATYSAMLEVRKILTGRKIL